MLPKISTLIERLNDGGIRYCHWKSNWALAETLDGETDLDLLVDRRDASLFRATLRDLGFRPAVEAGVRPLPSVVHHHALDDSTKAIAHVHAYFRVISGESLAKNFHLPLENMLLENRRFEDSVPIPAAGAELIVFVLRMLIKHTSPIELGLILRDADALRREVRWLMTDAAIEEALALLPRWLPQVETSLLLTGLEALRPSGGTVRRILLGLRVRRRLRGFARHTSLRAQLTGAAKFAAKASHRLAGSKKKLTPGAGGAVIAFVGSEATGKSTLLAEVESWLGKHFTVRRIHAGKPPSTAATLLPHALLPLLRKLLPEQRSTRLEAKSADDARGGSERFPLAFGFRSVMLAYERRALLIRAFARSSNGAIVLSDRYPSSRVGAPDSAQLQASATDPGPVRRRLCDLEARIYRDIPLPDLVIHLSAPLDVTLARNRARAKTEAEDYVRRRHAKNADVEFSGASVHRVDTDRPLGEVVGEVKTLIWEAL